MTTWISEAEKGSLSDGSESSLLCLSTEGANPMEKLLARSEGTVAGPATDRLPAGLETNGGIRHSLYAITGWLDEELAELAIGRLGVFSFRKGLYVYVGSARRNLRARIGRHLRPEKTRRWHFDYLRPHLRIIGVETFPGDEGECRLFRKLMAERGGTVPVRGFGSSDCGCDAHLFYVPDESMGYAKPVSGSRSRSSRPSL